MILPRLFNLIASAAAGFDAATHADVEVLLPEELLQGEVHPVAPVVARDGGDVDPLLLRHLAAEFAILGQPVLQR